MAMSASRWSGRRREGAGTPHGDPEGPGGPEARTELGALVREEVRRARTEVREEVREAGRTARLYAAALLAGSLALAFLSLTLVFLLWGAMDLRWAALIVTVLWAVAGIALHHRARTHGERLAHPERGETDAFEAREGSAPTPGEARWPPRRKAADRGRERP